MRLPQELFAEALWLEWDNHYGIIHKEKLPDLLRRYNLKLKKEKTLDDIQLAFGRTIISIAITVTEDSVQIPLKIQMMNFSRLAFLQPQMNMKFIINSC